MCLCFHYQEKGNISQHEMQRPFHHTLHFENDVPNAQRTCEDFYQLVELIRKSRKTKNKEIGTKKKKVYHTGSVNILYKVLGNVPGKNTDNLRDLSDTSWSAMRSFEDDESQNVQRTLLVRL